MSFIPSFFNSSFLEGGARENRKVDRIFGHSIINEPALNLSPIPPIRTPFPSARYSGYKREERGHVRNSRGSRNSWNL